VFFVPEAVRELVIAGVAALIVSARVAVPVPLLLVALIAALKDPETDGVPEIKPVELLTERPEGRPVAL
jgi:hypothetical protein